MTTEYQTIVDHLRGLDDDAPGGTERARVAVAIARRVFDDVMALDRDKHHGTMRFIEMWGPMIEVMELFVEGRASHDLLDFARRAAFATRYEHVDAPGGRGAMTADRIIWQASDIIASQDAASTYPVDLADLFSFATNGITGEALSPEEIVADYRRHCAE